MRASHSRPSVGKSHISTPSTIWQVWTQIHPFSRNTREITSILHLSQHWWRKLLNWFWGEGFMWFGQEWVSHRPPTAMPRNTVWKTKRGKLKHYALVIWTLRDAYMYEYALCALVISIRHLCSQFFIFESPNISPRVLFFLALMWHLSIQSSQPCQDINFTWKRGVVNFMGSISETKIQFQKPFSSPHYSAWYQLFASLGQPLKSEEEKDKKTNQ